MVEHENVRGPEAGKLHAMITAHVHGYDRSCRCRYGRAIDRAIDEAFEEGRRAEREVFKGLILEDAKNG